MARLLKKGDQGTEIKQVQTLLMEKGYLTDEEINGVFENETYRAVRLFQSQNLHRNGVRVDLIFQSANRKSELTPAKV